jgi:hypothetical protein
MTNGFWLFSAVCVGMFVIAALWRTTQAFDSRRLLRALLVTSALAVITSLLVFISSYAYFIDELALYGAVPLGVIVGVPILIAAFTLVRKRILYGPLLFLLPIAWSCAWNWLARPDGIWIRNHSKLAYASFFVPDGAIHLTRNGPRRHHGAIFELGFFSEMTFDDLTTFCTNHVRQAGFHLVEVKDFPKQDGPYHPTRTITYRNVSGQACLAYIWDNPPYPEHRQVRFQCFFDGALINPPPFVL